MNRTESLRAEILACCKEFLSEDQAGLLEAVLDDKLHGVQIVREETGLIPGIPAGERALREFFVSKAMRGLSPETLKSYSLEINRMLLYLRKDLLELTTNDIRYYLAHLQLDFGLKKSSLATVRSELCSLFSWLYNAEYIEKNPMLRIEPVKYNRGVRIPFDPEDVERLRDAAFSDPRDIAILDTFLSTGIRLGELVGLNRRDVDMMTRAATVTGKGNKTRTVYLSPRAIWHLKVYWAQRTDDNPAAFVKNREPYDRMTRSGVEKRLKTIGRMAGVENVFPHRFRHTAATNALQRGMNVEVVQQLLGHSCINTTMIYAKQDPEELRRSSNKYLAG